MEELPGQSIFQLNVQEIEALDTPVGGDDDDQSFVRKLTESIDRRTNRLTLSDADLGRVMCHMAQDTSKFEKRLRTAFARSLREHLTGPSQPWAD